MFIYIFINLYIDYISAELKWPRKLVRIRPGSFDFEPDSSQSRANQALNNRHGTHRPHRSTPNDSGPISACFDDDPKVSTVRWLSRVIYEYVLFKFLYYIIVWVWPAFSGFPLSSRPAGGRFPWSLGRLVSPGPLPDRNV